MTNLEAIEELKYQETMRSNGGDYQVNNLVIGAAISALEKQIPKKPIFDSLYACPTCHTIMLQGAFEARGKCCKECGQVLDWGENHKD